MIQQIENFKNFCYNIYVINKGQKPTKVHSSVLENFNPEISLVKEYSGAVLHEVCN